MTRGGQLGVGLVVTAGIALLLTWFFVTYERKEQSFPMPRKGEAAYNPLFAVKLALEDAGQRVHSRPHLFDKAQPLGRHDTVVLNGDPSRVRRSDATVLLDWVARGGHLVVEAPMESGLNKSGMALLARFGVRARTWDDEVDCLYIQAPPPKPANDEEEDEDGDFCNARFTIAKSPAPIASWGDAHGLVFARFAHGEGSVDVIDSNYPLRTPLVERHSGFIRQLLAPNWNRGAFHIVYSTDMPAFWTLLLRNGWMALVPLALLLLCWLRMRAQRFGPLMPAAPEARRSLLEHVQASGEHLYRYGRAHLLHKALRTHVLARIRRRDPVAASLEGQAQIAAIAQRTGLPSTDVADALHSPRPLDARDFRHRIARLISLGRNA